MKATILLWVLTSTAIKAPPIPPWPGNLPSTQQQATGTFLPTPTDKAVLDRLIFLDHYPDLCQAALNGLEAMPRDEPEPSFWDAYAWPITAVAGGLVAGGLIGYKLR